VAQTNEIETRQARLINLKDKKVAVFNVSGEFYAIENAGTHRGESLAEGAISEYQVTGCVSGTDIEVEV